MRVLKEPANIDLYVSSRPITSDDEKAVSEYIKADKQKRAKKASKKISPAKKNAA